MECPRRPHLLSIDHIMVAATFRLGLELRRVGAGGWLGDAERLKADLARGDAGEVTSLLYLAPMPQQGPHDVHLRVPLVGSAAGRIDFFEDRGGGPKRQPGTAISLGNERRQEAARGQLLDEGGRILR